MINKKAGQLKHCQRCCCKEPKEVKRLNQEKSFCPVLTAKATELELNLNLI